MRPGDNAAAEHRLKDAGAGHALPHDAGTRRPHPVPLGGARRAAHVPRAEHAARCTPSCSACWSAPIPDWETVSRWYWNLSEPHFDADAGDPGQGRGAGRRHCGPTACEDRGALQLCVAADPLHGHHRGSRGARLRAARRQRSRSRRATASAATRRRCWSRCCAWPVSRPIPTLDPQRAQEGRGGAAALLQPCHRRRARGDGEYILMDPDRREHDASCCPAYLERPQLPRGHARRARRC